MKRTTKPKAKKATSASSDSREWVECVAKSVERTANRYAEAANESSGTEHMIYGEICDAFRLLAENIRADAEEHSTGRTEAPRE